MRIMVIGVTQFMGRETVRRLVERGHDVSVMHRQDSHDLGERVANLQADRSDLQTVAIETALRASFDWYRQQPRRPVDYAFEDRLPVTA